MALDQELPLAGRLRAEVLKHQPASIAHYLQSEVATADVAALLSLWTQHESTTRSYIGQQGRIWHAAAAGAWTRIELATGQPWRPMAYFRAGGELFIVTDLGEGVQALRLQTGNPLDGCRNWYNGFVESTAGVISLRSVDREHLPAAICMVLRFSYQVAVGDDRKSEG